jgi:DNA primase
MAAFFGNELRQRVRDANDLVQVVKSYGLELQRSGRNLRACCPFHAEKKPSFNVNPEGQYFKCFGCGKSGDVFTFVMYQERVEFVEALKILADRAGITVEFSPEAAAQHRKESDWKSYLYKLNSVAAAFFHEMLYNEAGRAARDYLTRRRIAPEMWKLFNLGYAPGSGQSLLGRTQALHAPLNAVERAGLVSLREDGTAYDYFRDRLMFPIQDGQGRTIAFGGRVLDDGEPKYLNTRETPLFVKGHSIYALNHAREEIVSRRRAILVEGYTDVILCHQFGLKNVVAALGTAVTPEQIRALRRAADEIVILTDSDDAGARAAERSLAVLTQEEMRAHVVRLPGPEKDPCDFLLARGREPFDAALARPLSLFDYKYQRLAAEHDVGDAEGQARIAKGMLEWLALIPDPALRQAHRRELAGRLNLPESALQMGRGTRTGGVPERSAVERAEAVPAPEHPLACAEREMLRWLLHEPAWLPSAAGDLDLAALSGGPERRIGQALLAGLDEGRLPPPLEALQEQASAAPLVAREVLARLDPGSEEAEVGAARLICVALAEESPERKRLKLEEAYRLRQRALQEARVEYELAAAKRSVAAAQGRGSAEALEAARTEESRWLKALRELKRGPGGQQAAASAARRPV